MPFQLMVVPLENITPEFLNKCSVDPSRSYRLICNYLGYLCASKRLDLPLIGWELVDLLDCFVSRPGEYNPFVIAEIQSAYYHFIKISEVK